MLADTNPTSIIRRDFSSDGPRLRLAWAMAGHYGEGRSKPLETTNREDLNMDKRSKQTSRREFLKRSAGNRSQSGTFVVQN